MAAWSELTQEQRDEVIQLLAAVRDWSGQMARLGNLGRAIAAKYSGNVETTLGALDSGTIPVSAPGLGQEALTKSELITLVGYGIDSSNTADGASGSYNTAFHRALYTRAAGLYSTLQQGQG